MKKDIFYIINLTFNHVFVTLIYLEAMEKALKYKSVNDIKEGIE